MRRLFRSHNTFSCDTFPARASPFPRAKPTARHKGLAGSLNEDRNLDDFLGVIRNIPIDAAPRYLSGLSWDALQISAMKNPFMRGRSANVSRAGTVTANEVVSQSGMPLPIKMTLTINIATGPDAKIVAHAGPSSARMWPRCSWQNLQRSTGFKNDLKSLPLPQFGHLPLNPYHRVGAECRIPKSSM